MKFSTIQQALRHPAMNALKRPVTVKTTGYESSEWHLEEAEHSHAAPAQQQATAPQKKGYDTARFCPAKQAQAAASKNKPLHG